MISQFIVECPNGWGIRGYFPIIIHLHVTDEKAELKLRKGKCLEVIDSTDFPLVHDKIGFLRSCRRVTGEVAAILEPVWYSNNFKSEHPLFFGPSERFNAVVGVNSEFLTLEELKELIESVFSLPVKIYAKPIPPEEDSIIADPSGILYAEDEAEEEEGQ